jgi:ATP-dependent Zn protease
LSVKRKVLDNLAEALIREEILDKDDVDEIIKDSEGLDNN